MNSRHRQKPLAFDHLVRSNVGPKIELRAPSVLTLHVFNTGELIHEGGRCNPKLPVNPDIVPHTMYCRSGASVFEIDITLHTSAWLVGADVMTCEGQVWRSEYDVDGSRLLNGPVPCLCNACGNFLPTSLHEGTPGHAALLATCLRGRCKQLREDSAVTSVTVGASKPAVPDVLGEE